MKCRDKAVKIYKITFNEYTNVFKDVVVSKDNEYIQCDKHLGTLLIREDEYDFYRQYGDGIKSIDLVGIMYVPDNV